MTKSDLVDAISKGNPAITRNSVETVVNTVFDSMMDAMSRDERVEIRGFGSFTVRHRDARKGRNPKTGEPVDVPAKRMPHFKAGKQLSDRMNQGSGS